MYEISVSDELATMPIDAGCLEGIIRKVLEVERVARAEISLALVDGKTMRSLNCEHLQHDYDTDVLSFLLECDPPEIDQTGIQEERGAGKSVEGEVIVSTDIAQKVAADFGWNPDDEIVLYSVHGLLHLLGYDDLSLGEQQIMRNRERVMLSYWNLVPSYAE